MFALQEQQVLQSELQASSAQLAALKAALQQAVNNEGDQAQVLQRTAAELEAARVQMQVMTHSILNCCLQGIIQG